MLRQQQGERGSTPCRWQINTTMKGNTPYRKRFDANGVLMNPITKEVPYISNLPTRADRRNNPSQRFKGNHKGNSLTVSEQMAYHRVIQLVPLKVKNTLTDREYIYGVKRVGHYVAKRSN